MVFHDIFSLDTILSLDEVLMVVSTFNQATTFVQQDYFVDHFWWDVDLSIDPILMWYITIVCLWMSAVFSGICASAYICFSEDLLYEQVSTNMTGLMLCSSLVVS